MRSIRYLSTNKKSYKLMYLYYNVKTENNLNEISLRNIVSKLRVEVFHKLYGLARFIILGFVEERNLCVGVSSNVQAKLLVCLYILILISNRIARNIVFIDMERILPHKLARSVLAFLPIRIIHNAHRIKKKKI